STFRLLTREDEHALARRLEKADLAITRALLSAPEGRAALLEVVRRLNDHELRVEDVERNPSEELVDRATRIAHEAERFMAKTRTRAHPPARGLRLHPRVVRVLVAELEELR